MSFTGGSASVRGTTVRVSYALKARVSSHIPKGSLSRSWSGPSGKRPRRSERTR